MQVGEHVSESEAGDLAGIGCTVDSCQQCSSCREEQEHYCELGFAGTYNGTEMDRKTPTFGGYSNRIVVIENFVLPVSDKVETKAEPMMYQFRFCW